MFSTIGGFSVGFMIRLWANALQKQRLFYRKLEYIPDFDFRRYYPFLIPHAGPWEHLVLGGIGAYIGYNYTSWENQLLAQVNQKRETRGMVPITRKDIKMV